MPRGKTTKQSLKNTSRPVDLKDLDSKPIIPIIPDADDEKEIDPDLLTDDTADNDEDELGDDAIDAEEIDPFGDKWEQ